MSGLFHPILEVLYFPISLEFKGSFESNNSLWLSFFFKGTGCVFTVAIRIDDGNQTEFSGSHIRRTDQAIVFNSPLLDNFLIGHQSNDKLLRGFVFTYQLILFSYVTLFTKIGAWAQLHGYFENLGSQLHHHSHLVGGACAAPEFLASAGYEQSSSPLLDSYNVNL